MGLAKHARKGIGKVTKAHRARTGDVEKQYAPTPQGVVPSNIPMAGPQGVPPVEVGGMGTFSRTGNPEMKPTAVGIQTGMIAHGPRVAALLARMGGQVRLAPGQIGAWAAPADPTPKVSEQVSFDPAKPGSLPPPAGPIIP